MNISIPNIHEQSDNSYCVEYIKWKSAFTAESNIESKNLVSPPCIVLGQCYSKEEAAWVVYNIHF